MRSEKQKLLNTFVMTESEANRHFLAACPGKTEEGMNRFKRHLRNQPVGTAKNRVIIFLFFLFFFSASFGLAASEAIGATYYVKNGGNDRLAGTSDATAWARCPGMAGWSGTASLASGDIVYFREGGTWTSTARPILATKEGVTYYGKGYGSTGVRAKLQSLVGTPSGTPSDGVIDIYASNVTVKGFEIDANEQSIGGIYIGYKAPSDITDIAVDDCIIHDTGGDEAIPTEYYYGIIVGQSRYYGTHNVTITNCEIFRTGHEGIAIYPSRGTVGGISPSPNHVENITVRGCKIHDAGYWGGKSWGHGITIALNAKNVLIEYNTVYNALAGTIAVTTYCDNPSPGFPDNVTIRYNLVYSSPTTSTMGISMIPQLTDYTGWGNVFVYGNILIDSTIYLAGGNYGNMPLKIYNNTIYNTQENLRGIWLYHTAKNTGGIEIKNNLIYTGDGGASLCVDDYGSLIADNNHSNNLYYRASGSLVRRDSGALLYTTSNINTWESTAQSVDPLFTGGTLPTGFIGTNAGIMIPNTNFFNISSGNAINNGATLGGPYDGCVNWTGSEYVACRPAGAYDIGAYEIPNVLNPVTEPAAEPVPRSKVSKVSKKTQIIN